MKFRTEIEPINSHFTLSHDDRIVMLGSCFTDSIGEQLQHDGFDVVRNPLGPLYNPYSIANIFTRNGQSYSIDEMQCHDGIWHCLDFASRYNDKCVDKLVDKINHDYQALWQAILEATTIIITFGTARTYQYTVNDRIVGNCHRLPASFFYEHVLSVDEIVTLWRHLLPMGKKVIFTLSPIRYVADGLVNNSLSKAILRIAIDEIYRAGGFDYFPAYEIINDDLRDYRFYTADLKHPSDMAVEYVYERFVQTYFNATTKDMACRCRKEWHRSLHDPNFKH